MVHYEYDKDTNCFHMTFDKTYTMDATQLVKILNINKRLKIDYIDTYPYYYSNGKSINMLQILFGLKCDNLDFVFRNNNPLDVRPCNVIINHEYHDVIKSKYEIAKYIPGHYSETGIDAYVMKNPIWVTEQGDYIMYCEKYVLCILCEKGLNIIREYEKKNNIKISFHSQKTGYISGSGGKLYIHQILMDFYGQGKGTKNGSVDHINRNTCDNRLCNLRIVSHEVQQSNKIGAIISTKKSRSKSAQPLPDGLIQSMMPKYVGYYKECYNKEKKIYREFFKIEKHSKCETARCGSKSAKFTWQEKLEAILVILYNINNNIVVDTPNKLPMYYRIVNMRGAEHLHYEKRVDGKRISLKMKMIEGADVGVEMCRFNKKLYNKYPEIEEQS